MMTYWLETYGCQMNKAESEALEILLQSHNIYPSSVYQEADIVILNTCSVRQTAENRIWGRLGFYKKEKSKRHFFLVIIGCMSQRLKNLLQEKVPEIDIVLGTFEKHEIIKAIKKIGQDDSILCLTREAPYQFVNLYSQNSFKSFVPIMHGCDNYCSYCIVPYIRGREISRSPEDILNEITILDQRKVKEITLLGQNVNSYNYSKNGKSVYFHDILFQVAEITRNIEWIRFITSHPKDFSLKLINLIKKYPNLCRHIHLPVQHGSNKILSLMKRKYTRENYLSLIKSIKNAISDISITTDILIGFPFEEDEDFRMTCELLTTIEFDDAYTYYYNPREGTEAFLLKDTVPHSLKIERLNQIIMLQRNISQQKKKKKLGKQVKVLVEEESKKDSHELLARTEHDEMVVFPGRPELIGTFVNVELISLHGITFKGNILNKK
jgi:tRNA-2-methylthio-N6-dimethylallyladenosine synthase